MKVDPRQRKAARKEAGHGEIPEEGAGVKRVKHECKVPGAVVGWEHFESSRKGTPGLMVRFVVFEGPDAGAISERNFWKTDRAIDQFLDFLLALGWEEPLDIEDDDQLERAFATGAVGLVIRGEDWKDREGNTRTKYEPAFFYRYREAGKPEWNAMVEEAEKGWAGYVKWREEHPRPSPGENSGSGDGGGSGGGSYGGDDDSIPF